MSPAHIKELFDTITLPVQIQTAEKRLQRGCETVIGSGRTVWDTVRFRIARTAKHVQFFFRQSIHNGPRRRGLRRRADEFYCAAVQTFGGELMFT